MNYFCVKIILYFLKYVLIYFCMFVKILLHLNVNGGIGEVVNTTDCGSVMHEFDSHISPHIKNKNQLYGWFFVVKSNYDKKLSFLKY